MFLQKLDYHHGKLVEKIPLMLMKEKFGPLLQTSKSAAPNIQKRKKRRHNIIVENPPPPKEFD